MLEVLIIGNGDSSVRIPIESKNCKFCIVKENCVITPSVRVLHKDDMKEIVLVISGKESEAQYILPSREDLKAFAENLLSFANSVPEYVKPETEPKKE